MPANHSAMRLGKQAPKHDDRTLKLAKYLVPENLPPPPDFVDYSQKLSDIPLLLNDKLGDCTIAAVLHMQSVFCSNSGRPFKITDEEALEAYSRICGYDPKQTDPKTDENPTDS